MRGLLTHHTSSSRAHAACSKTRASKKKLHTPLHSAHSPATKPSFQPFELPLCSSNKRRSVACCASSQEESGEPSTSGDAGTPWQFGFQINERYLQLDWGGHSANEMTRRVISTRLNISLEEVDRRLEALSNLLPDMVGKLSRMRSDILVNLTADVDHTAAKLLGLRDLFPGVNVSLLVSRWPYMLADYELEDVAARLDELRQKLPGVRVELLVDKEPQIMKVNIDQVLANIKRIVPYVDPKTVLLALPHMVLDMEQLGLPTAMEMGNTVVQGRGGDRGSAF